MFYLFTGNDFDNKKKAFSRELERFSDFDQVFVSLQEFSPSFLESYIDSQSLFGKKSVIVLDGVLEIPENMDYIFKKVKDFDNSENIFIFLEGEMKKTDLKKIEKKVKNINIFEKTEKKEQKFNVFSITDSFNRKDKKNTWVLMQKALKSDIPAMDVANILIWSIKNLILAKGKRGTDADIKKSGLNPYVFKKALGFSGKWSEDELQKALQNIVFLYHDDRRGEKLATDLELFILKTL